VDLSDTDACAVPTNVAGIVDHKRTIVTDEHSYAASVSTSSCVSDSAQAILNTAATGCETQSSDIVDTTVTCTPMQLDTQV